jgi:hypothetical protein
MKKSNPTVDEIRRGMTQFQTELVSEIWEHFRAKNEWPVLRKMYSDHGKQKVSKALLEIGKGVGYEDTSGQRWPRYQLSLLGALLTRDGLIFQALMKRYFQFQRKQFKDDPLKDLSTSVEIAEALNLNAEEAVLLGQLIRLGSFGGGYGKPNEQWSVNAMDEAADFPKTGDLSAQVDKWVCRHYQPYTGKYESRQNTGFLPNLFLAGPAETAVQPHLSEIAMSLERLRKKYPDQTKLGFLVMRFTKGKPFERIVEVIKRTAEKHGLVIIRADENEFHAHLWENVRTLLHGCGFGIAIYERIEREEPNANVGLEIGYLMAMNKPVLLLKDKTVGVLQADLAGKLYKSFDPHEPEKTIPDQLTAWLADNGIIVPKHA